LGVLFQRPSPGGAGSPGSGSGASAAGANTRRNEDAEIRQIIDRRLVSAEFQPLVSLAGREPWAFEALARGPASSPLGAPGAMFAAAARVGLAGELDRVAHAAAFGTVLDNSPGYRLPLSVNTGLLGLSTPNPEDLAEVAERAQRQFPVIVELAESAVAADPLGALAAVDRARTDGMRIAVDNVGLNPASFVLLPLLQPDVVKLDRSLVADARAAQTLIDGLADYFRHSRVHVVAQGVEQEEHLDLAVAMSARYGQGYLFGRPLPLPKGTGLPAGTAWDSTPPSPDAEMTPDELLGVGADSPTADLAVVRQVATLMTHRAEAHPEPAVIILVSPAGGLAADAWLLPRSLVKRSALTVMLTPDEIRKPIPDVTAHAVPATDPLATRFALAILTVDGASLLAARPGPDGPTGPYQYQITRDRGEVLRACRPLLRRFTA
jgi:EAL domain-containing protein (putative c-di-GMP-specific phosphodiesterase class I)